MQSKQKAKEDLFSSSKIEMSMLVAHENKDVVDQAVLEFKEIIRDDMERNKTLKTWFFWISCGILVVITLTLILMVYRILTCNLPDNTPTFAAEIISLVASFITAFMILPKIIAEHLFSSTIHDTFTKVVESHEKNKTS